MNKNIYDLGRYDGAGYDREGYDIWGYDRDGLDREDFNKFGYDREGFNRNGYDRDGFSRFQEFTKPQNKSRRKLFKKHNYYRWKKLNRKELMNNS